MLTPPLLGIHHVTAICGDAQKNLDFYTKVLGLRMVKATVNFDDPTAYHLYYGDEVGTPGTIITFFAYPKGQHGARGAGSFNSISLEVPDGSLDYWFERIADQDPEWYVNAHGERSIIFEDPDGLRLALIEGSQVSSKPWTRVIDGDYAIRGIVGVCLGARLEHSRKFFEETLGFPFEFDSPMQSGQVKSRLRVGSQHVDIMPNTMRTMSGRGTLHHVAFRIADQNAQSTWLSLLQSKGVNVSPVRDRSYFFSIYFREPGAALCEIATDVPGFTADEAVHELGSSLRIPAPLMGQASAIAGALPPLRLTTELV